MSIAASLVADADTGKFKRMWGAYGHVPDDSVPRDRRLRSAAHSSSICCMA